MLEKFIFDVMYEFLNKNNLLTPKKSRFPLSISSTVNQLIPITDKICKAFDEYPSKETHAIFIVIFKALDNAWDKGVTF